MPAYNHERFVGAAVSSVLQQSHSDWKLIVIDDGSTDKTGDVVRSFHDSRIQYIFQENRDAYNTLNRGLGMVDTPYAAILNSDDVYEPERLRRLIDVQRSTNAQCLFTDVSCITDKGEKIADPGFFWNQWHQKNREFYLDCADLYTAFLHGNVMVTTSNLFMTHDAVMQVGDFCSLRYLHDYDFIFRTMLAFPQQVLYLHDEVLLQYRVHGSNTLSEAAVTGREQDRQIIRKYLLARCPESLHGAIDTGIDRLIALEHELVEARAQLKRTTTRDTRAEPVRSQAGPFARLRGLLR